MRDSEDTTQNFSSPSPRVIFKSRAFFSRQNSRLPAVYGCVSHSTTPVTQPLAKFISCHSILSSSNTNSVIKKIRKGTFALTFESEKRHPSISAEWLTRRIIWITTKYHGSEHTTVTLFSLHFWSINMASMWWFWIFGLDFDRVRTIYRPFRGCTRNCDEFQVLTYRIFDTTKW